MRIFIRSVLMFAATCLCGTTLQADEVIVGFDGGTNGGFAGNFNFEASGGNPGGVAATDPNENLFFPELRTGAMGEPSNSAFLGDYSGFANVTFGFDVMVTSITDFIGNDISRPFGIMLIDNDIVGLDGPSGVFFETEILSSLNQPDWTTYSVTINDLTSSDLPSGWIGFGDTDLMTFEPILPAGATFATVLAGVDEFRLTGAVPGFFFNDAFFDMKIDNIRVTTVGVPEPGSTTLILLTGLSAITCRRSRRNV